MDQKKRERGHLEEFKKNYLHFPEGEIEEREKPDFLIHGTGKVTGIELTELYQLSFGRKCPLQAQEKLRCRIIEKARKMYEENRGDPVDVSVGFDWGYTIKDKDICRISRELYEFVCGSISESKTKDYVEIGMHAEGSKDPPESIRWIKIRYNDPGGRRVKNNFWHILSVKSIPYLQIPYLQGELNKKNDKYDTYKESSDEVWLIFLIELMEYGGLSSAFVIPDETKENEFESPFDKIFLFSVWEGKVYELCKKIMYYDRRA